MADMKSDDSKRSLSSVRAKVEERSGGVPIRERYGLVLFLILVAYLLAGLDSGRVVGAMNALLWVSLLLTTLWAPGVPERLRRIGGLATLLVLVTSISLGFIPSDTAQAARLLLLSVAQLAALLAILSMVTQHERVTLQTVMGGVAAYALIAFVMAALYHGFDLLTDDAFLNGVVAVGDYTYFSFVTLTTVGYGDITAASDFAKRLVVVEAFVGQVFIITLVARLVSLWGKPISN
jgi:voltage-gated potassium channel Kch